MIPFAQLKSFDNTAVTTEVLNVVVVSEKNCENNKGEFEESVGVSYLRTIFRDNKSLWVRGFEPLDPDQSRGSYPCPGDSYDIKNQRFIPAELKT